MGDAKYDREIMPKAMRTKPRMDAALMKILVSLPGNWRRVPIVDGQGWICNQDLGYFDGGRPLAPMVGYHIELLAGEYRTLTHAVYRRFVKRSCRV